MTNRPRTNLDRRAARCGSSSESCSWRVRPGALSLRCVVLATTVLLAAGLGGPRGAMAQGVVDQSHVCSQQIYQILFYSPVGQSFVPTKGSINAIEVWLMVMNTPQSDTVTLRLRDGGIAGPVLASGSQSLVAPPNDLWVRYDFPAPVDVVPGNTYVIELAATNASWGWVADLPTATCPEYPFGVAMGNSFIATFPPRDWNFRTYTLCGDGNLDAGEECDDGAATGTAASCCSASCQPVEAGTVCGPSQGACDVVDVCDGVSGSCPDDVVAAGTSCRAPVGECDAEDFCDGVGVGCADDQKPAGTACTDDGAPCTADVCSGTGACTHPASNAGTICRAAADACDVAESCTGASASCPADQVLPDGDADGECDLVDACTSAGAQTFASKPKSSLVIGRINTDTQPGNDKLALGAAFTLPPSVPFGNLNLAATGAHVVVEASDGDRVVDVTVPSGAYSPISKRGWTLAASGRQWTYADAGATPASGIKKITVGDRSSAATPGRVQVKVVGAKGTFPVVAADAPLQARVTLGGQAEATAGVCGESAFAPGDCSLNGPGNQIRCRR